MRLSNNILPREQYPYYSLLLRKYHSDPYQLMYGWLSDTHQSKDTLHSYKHTYSSAIQPLPFKANSMFHKLSSYYPLKDIIKQHLTLSCEPMIVFFDQDMNLKEVVPFTEDTFESIIKEHLSS